MAVAAFSEEAVTDADVDADATTTTVDVDSEADSVVETAAAYGSYL